MNLKKFFRLIPMDKREKIQKVIDTLTMGRRSEKTIENYVCAINRFLDYFENKDISKLNESDIIEYIKNNYLNKQCATNTYNMNISAIKYFYSVYYNKELNNKLLPRAKLTKRLPTTIDKETFIKILNEEKNLKHKCWLLLGYCSGLRIEEVVSVKLQKHNIKINIIKSFFIKRTKQDIYLKEIKEQII